MITVVKADGSEILSTRNCKTVAEVRIVVAQKMNRNLNRVVLKVDGVAVSDNDAFSGRATYQYKDIGPQIGYRTVFYIEYFGPMLFVFIYAFCQNIWNGSEFSLSSLINVNALNEMNWVARWGVYAWFFHFLKREYETCFIHKFSRPTMPLSNLYKNCGYYWSFGIFIGYPLCNPNYIPPSNINMVYIGALIFILSELGNFAVHVSLSNMRPSGEGKGSEGKREIPKGFGFSLVACPNYTFEVMSWIGFSIMTGIPQSWAFTLLGFYQMQEWAQKKHKDYKKKYDKEYTKLNRKAIIPFIY